MVALLGLVVFINEGSPLSMVFFVSFPIKAVNIGCLERANDCQGTGCPDSGSRRVIVPASGGGA